jgi:hypothetical protein
MRLSYDTDIDVVAFEINGKLMACGFNKAAAFSTNNVGSLDELTNVRFV